MKCEITIGDIKLESKEEHINVEFKTNTLNNDDLERASYRVEFKISGDITDENFEQLYKLAKWSYQAEDIYKDLEIKIWNKRNGTFLRKYTFDQMWCVDYSETFDEAKGSAQNGAFELYIVQSPRGKVKNVDIYED